MINLNDEKKWISKEIILKHYQDIDIYRRYMNGDVTIGGIILSPLRKESKPSFGFFKGESGEICYKDFVLGTGDCIKFVQVKFGLTYFEALSKIATDFDLHHDYICKKSEKTQYKDNKMDYPTRDELLSKVTVFKLGKKKRDWLAHDILFWEQYGIGIKTLNFFNVQPISYIFMNDKIFLADKYAYCFVEHKDGKETYKIYQPFNESFKWINGHDDSVWSGWEQLPNTGIELIVTKSLKDVMSLYEVCGIPAISLQSENIIPKKHVFEQLDKRFITKYSLYDNDYDKEINWGRKFADKIASTFGLIDICIPDRYETKDFSDLVKKYGKDKAKFILEQNLVPF